MPDNSFENFRLTLMQDFLPVGMALLDRAKKGGIAKVAEIFNTSEDPVIDLRNEGSVSASILRERLDDISPGLGNPVMKVQVSVEDIPIQEEKAPDDTSLLLILQRIDQRIDLLKEHIDD